jgi:Uma2 family endonuclease
MAQQVALPPVAREQWLPMSWEEFLDWCSEGQSEWVDGKGIAYVSNTPRHDEVLQFLNFLVQWFVRANDLGDVFASTTLMRLASRPSGRMPDLFVVLKQHRHRRRRRWYEGPASFALEVLSDRSRFRDLEEKLREYAVAGIPEYLIVDGREGHFIFLWYRLGADGDYQPIEPDDEGRYHSTVLPGFWLDPTWLQQDPLPNPIRLLPRIAPDAWGRFLSETETAI